MIGVKNAVYEAYTKDVCRRESVDVALERAINIMIKWGEEKKQDFTNFFKFAEHRIGIKDDYIW